MVRLPTQGMQILEIPEGKRREREFFVDFAKKMIFWPPLRNAVPWSSPPDHPFLTKTESILA